MKYYLHYTKRHLYRNNKDFVFSLISIESKLFLKPI